MPACTRCPLRIAVLGKRPPEQGEGLAALVEEILRGSPHTLPDAVNDALLALSLARGCARKRFGAQITGPSAESGTPRPES